MTYSESPFSQLSDELWHVFGGRRRFPTTRGHWSGAALYSCPESPCISDPLSWMRFDR